FQILLGCFVFFGCVNSSDAAKTVSNPCSDINSLEISLRPEIVADDHVIVNYNIRNTTLSTLEMDKYQWPWSFDGSIRFLVVERSLSPVPGLSFAGDHAERWYRRLDIPVEDGNPLSGIKLSPNDTFSAR